MPKEKKRERHRNEKKKIMREFSGGVKNCTNHPSISTARPILSALKIFHE